MPLLGSSLAPITLVPGPMRKMAIEFGKVQCQIAPLVTGLGFAQIGIDKVVTAVTADNDVFWLRSLLVSVGTLTVMVGFSVWGRGPFGTL